VTITAILSRTIATTRLLVVLGGFALVGAGSLRACPRVRQERPSRSECYLIQPRDKLVIQVEPALGLWSRTSEVLRDGSLWYPTESRPFVVGGKTRAQAMELLRQSIARYIKHAEVTIDVVIRDPYDPRLSREDRVLIRREHQRPVGVLFRERMSVWDALHAANDAAEVEKVRVVHRGGVSRAVRVGHQPKESDLLRPGDEIWVAGSQSQQSR